MKPSRLYNFYKQSQDNELVISFKSTVTQRALVEVAGFLKEQLGSSGPEKRVFAVFIELSQNVLHHSLERGPEDEDGCRRGVGIMEVTEIDDCYVVSSGNLVSREDSSRLRDLVHRITTCSPEELKEQIKQQRSVPMTDGHAGLGLLEVARRTDQRLSITLEGYDCDHDFMVLSAKVAKKGGQS